MRFVRYRFRFVSGPWLDTDTPSKHCICLQDVFKTYSRHLFKTSSSYVFKTCSSFRLNNFSCWDVFKTHLQDVLGRRKIITLKISFKTSWRPTNIFWVEYTVTSISDIDVAVDVNDIEDCYRFCQIDSKYL